MGEAFRLAVTVTLTCAIASAQAQREWGFGGDPTAKARGGCLKNTETYCYLLDVQCDTAHEPAFIHAHIAYVSGFEGGSIEENMRYLRSKYDRMVEYSRRDAGLTNFGNAILDFNNLYYGRVGGFLMYQNVRPERPLAPMRGYLQAVASRDYEEYQRRLGATIEANYEGKTAAAVEYQSCVPKDYVNGSPTGRYHILVIFDVVDEIEGCGDVVQNQISGIFNFFSPRMGITAPEEPYVCGQQTSLELPYPASNVTDRLNAENGVVGKDVGCIVNFGDSYEREQLYDPLWYSVQESIGDSGFNPGVVEMGNCVKDWWILSAD